MWHLIAAVLLSSPLQGNQSLTIKGTVFGPRQRLACEWFSNFENNRFERCRVVGGAALPLEDGASVECLGQTCKELDAATRKATRWKKPEPVEGTFAVEIYGRLSAARHEKRYLGDATSIVLVEKLVSVRRR